MILLIITAALIVLLIIINVLSETDPTYNIRTVKPNQQTIFLSNGEILNLNRYKEQNMNEFEAKITNITTDLADTLIAKNHDYGNAFHESVEEFGNVAMIISLNNKINRIKTLAKSDNKVKDESMRDTLLDLAGYAILSINELDKSNTTTIYGSGQPYSVDTQFPLPK